MGSADRILPRRTASPRGTVGATLPEALFALLLIAILAGATAHGFEALDRLSLARSADLAHGHLQRARLEALARRERVVVRAGGSGRLLLLDAAGNRLADVDLASEGLLRLDSVRVRPPSIRYNARGQGSPGSVTLYRGRRGVRLVVNFIGRVRRHAFRF